MKKILFSKGCKRVGVVIGICLVLLGLFLGFGRREPITELGARSRVVSVEPQATERGEEVAPAPKWAVGYGNEFWRAKTPSSRQASPAEGAVNVQEVIDRVSHAFRATGGEAPVSVGRDFRARVEGAALHFAPAAPNESAAPDFKISTASVTVGDHSIFSSDLLTASEESTRYLGNTVQNILTPEAGLVQHLQARGEGVELTWIIEARPPGGGSLRVEAELGGLNYCGASDRGFHFADSSGTARVRIGHATLVDSSGNRAGVPTEVVGNRLVVQVPADLLATAEYPIGIDPLISAEFGMDRPVSAVVGGENAKVASNGTDYLVVWHDWRSNSDIDIYATRVSRDGWILDPNGIGIRVGYAGQDKFAVASNGDNYLIVWTEYGNAIMGARLSSGGAVLDNNAFLVCESPLFPSNLSAAGNGDDYLVLWRDNRDHRSDIYGGVVRASDARVSDVSGTKLAEDTGFPGTAAAVAPHLGAFVAIWRASGKTEGAFLRIQDGRIAPIAKIELPSAGGLRTEPAVASGPGGILVAWEDFTEGSNGTDIYGQLLGPTGQPVSAKFPICAAAHNQTRPAVAATSANFVVAWQDNRRGAGMESTNDIYFASVAYNGTVAPVNGQRLTTEPANDADRQNQKEPVIASNGQQSLIVWNETSLDFNQSVRSARITVEGTNLDPRSLPVTVATVNPQQAPAVAANSEGFLVAWSDQRNGADIYGARFTRDGRILDPAGIVISAARGAQNYLALTSNGTDYFAVWSDSRNIALDFGTDIYGARISAAGTVIDPSGIPINSSRGYDFYPKAASDGTNYLVVWQRIEFSDNQVYARAIRSSGDPLVSPSTHIDGPNSDQLYPSVASNGREYIVAWTDGDQFQADAYGQRVDHLGGLIGVAFPISTAAKRQVAPLIASNGDGYFVTWLDGNYDGSNFDPQTMSGTRLSATGQVLDNPALLVQPESHYYIQRALASDGRDYLVLWQIMNGPIHAIRVKADGQHFADGSFTVASSGSWLSQPALAGRDGTFLVAYTSAAGSGEFPRVRGKTVQFTLPDPWLDTDIGVTPTPGTGAYKDGVFEIAGSGDANPESEGLHYVYQTLEGDGQIIARLNQLATPTGSGRAGIMIRDSTAVNSAHAFIGLNGNGKTVFTRRKYIGDTRVHTGDATFGTPIWFKLIRAGELILAYRSTDGVTWRRFDTTTIDFGQKVQVGLAITSNDPALASAKFDRVSIWRFQAPIDAPIMPTLAIERSDSGAATLTLSADDDSLVRVETSVDLLNWVPVETMNGGAATLEVGSQPTESARFYRVVPTD